MSDHDFWAAVKKESPRYADWDRVFNDPGHVPISSPIAERVNLPVGTRPVLFVRYDLLTPGEQARMIIFVAARFHEDPQSVQDALEADPRHGMPLLAEDVSVTVLHPQKWLHEIDV